MRRAIATAAGIATDDRGPILTGTTLRSVSHPQVHAVGDAASARMDFGQLHGSCQSGLPTAQYTADAIARLVRGKTVKPFRFGYFHQPVSLGRKDAVIEFTKADSTPVGMRLTGRGAVWYEELASGSPLMTYRYSKSVNVTTLVSKGGRATRSPRRDRLRGSLTRSRTSSPCRAWHARAVREAGLAPGVVAHHLDEAAQAVFLRAAIERAGLADPDRVLGLMLPSAVSYGACTNRAFLIAAALGCRSVHRRDSDSRYQERDGEPVFPVRHELAFLGKGAREAAAAVTEDRLAAEHAEHAEYADRPVASMLRDKYKP